MKAAITRPAAMLPSGRLETPTVALVQKYVSIYRGEPDSVASDNALDLLITTFPRNDKLEEVFLKVAAVNQIYRGGIQKESNSRVDPIYQVAKRISELDADVKLEQGSLELATEMAYGKIQGVKNRYVFATKYCHWHRPDIYSISDGNATELIWRYQQQERFARGKAGFPKKGDVESNYRVYKEVIDQFVNNYNLNGISYRELDKFLWRYKGQ
jgi:hypothetical protein